MTTDIERTAEYEEEVFLIGRLSHWSLFWSYFFGLLLLPLFGLGAVFWLVAYIKRATTELGITGQRVILKRGFISREVLEIALPRVESLRIEQSPMGRLLDFGSVQVIGTGNSHLQISGIAQPIKFREAFHAAAMTSRRSTF